MVSFSSFSSMCFFFYFVLLWFCFLLFLMMLLSIGRIMAAGSGDDGRAMVVFPCGGG